MPDDDNVKASRRRLGESAVSHQVAEEACTVGLGKRAENDNDALQACIFDVLATGDLEIATAGNF